jgi:hypothetical protein
MKALSVKEPWASRIIFGPKTIELRTWQTSYRGLILICASSKPDAPTSGMALGTVELVDCRPATDADEKDAMCPIEPRDFAWVFAQKKILGTPFGVKGMLGLFNLTIEDVVKGVSVDVIDSRRLNDGS